MSKNTNCLEGVKCPECGNEDNFKVVAAVWIDLTDNGAEVSDTDGSFEYDDESAAICGECNYSNNWAAFQTEED